MVWMPISFEKRPITVFFHRNFQKCSKIRTSLKKFRVDTNHNCFWRFFVFWFWGPFFGRGSLYRFCARTQFWRLCGLIFVPELDFWRIRESYYVLSRVVRGMIPDRIFHPHPYPQKIFPSLSHPIPLGSYQLSKVEQA